MSKGVKYDSGKPEMYLLPPLAMQEVGKVLTYGAKKYSPDNWRKVESLEERYMSAALRHIFDHMAGETLDDETDLASIAHSICCLLFILEDRLLNGQESKKESRGEPESGEYSEGVCTYESGQRKSNFKKRSVPAFKHRV